MTIQSLDPSGELGKLFFQVRSKDLHGPHASESQAIRPTLSQDAVDLSAVAKAISDLTARAAALPDIRSDRVESVRESLQAGIPAAKTEQVAEALIRETFRNRGAA